MSEKVPWDAAIWLLFIFGIPLASASIVVVTAALRGARKRGRLSRPPFRFENKWVLRSSAAILAIYFVAFSYGLFIEANWIEQTTTEILVRQPVLGHDRFRIVHLSDLHMTQVGRREKRAVEIVREAKPDLIVVTGDFGESPSKTASAVNDLMGRLEATYGIYGVTGNNDWKAQILNEMSRTGRMKLLRDETVILERNGRQLRLAGQDERPKKPLREILRGQGTGAYTIYLNHKPDAVDELRSLHPGQNVDLFLCGHTHGGQVCLPFWGAVVTESKYHKKYERGWYYLPNGIPMYVNRGVGMVSGMPVRFLARPEVAVIDLVFKNPAGGRQEN